MILLAADTSCDESCVAIVDTEQWKLLADVVQTHVPKMAPYGGVVPELASREHLKALPLVLEKALQDAGLTLDQIDHFAVTNRPGLIGALLVGVSYIKALAFAEQKPFSVLDHIEGHLYSPLLAGFEAGRVPPPFPWIALVVSGGHSELFLVKSETESEWLGGSLDDAAGEAFDKIGKLLGLPYPAGPVMDRWVREKATDEDRHRFALPRAQTKTLDFSFSGLKTAVSLQLKKLGTPSEGDRLALAASAQEAILDALIRKTREAQKQHGVQTVVISGGVACNSRLREVFSEAFFPAPRHCADNAAMIALLAALRLRSGALETAPFSVTAVARR